MSGGHRQKGESAAPKARLNFFQFFLDKKFFQDPKQKKVENNCLQNTKQNISTQIKGIRTLSVLCCYL